MVAATADTRARLAAGAAQGTAGVAAYDDAAKQVRQSRDQAIASITSADKGIAAPTALTRQLSAQIAAPAQSALGDIASLGATAAFGAQQQQKSTDDYMNESNAALPMIRADADKNLAQQLAMLNAQRARTVGGGGGGGGGSRGGISSLSDSELRNRLLGYAQQVRNSAAASMTHDLPNARALSTSPQAWGGVDPAIGKTYGYEKGPVFNDWILNHPVTGTPMEPAAGAALADQMQQWTKSLPAVKHPVANANPNPALAGGLWQSAAPSVAKSLQAINSPDYWNEHRNLAFKNAQLARAAAIDRIALQQWGPGITQEAQQIGIQAGLDPAVVTGLLSPQYDRQYADANRKLGLYKDPNAPQKETVSTLILDQNAANRVLKQPLSANDINAVLNQKSYDRSSNPYEAAFTKYLENAGVDVTDAKKVQAAQAAFENDPTTQRLLLRNPYDAFRTQLANLADQGYDEDAAKSKLMQAIGPDLNDPTMSNALRLAEASVSPRFEAYAATKGRRTVTVYPGAQPAGG